MKDQNKTDVTKDLEKLIRTLEGKKEKEGELYADPQITNKLLDILNNVCDS